MNQPEAVTAAAYAETARLGSLIRQQNRLQQAGCAEGAYAAHHCVQTSVARLYEHLERLPDDDPAAGPIHAQLDNIALSYEPEAPVPQPAFVQRLGLIAAAAAIKQMVSHAGDSAATNQQRRAYAEQAAKESGAATAVANTLSELPPSGWSRRQARAFENEAHAAAKQAQDDANDAIRIYRAGLPYLLMPALARSGLSARGRINMLNALDRHYQDNIHIVLTQPSDNAARETPLRTAVGLVYQSCRYLKTVDEPYPAGYPTIKAIASLRDTARQLEGEANRNPVADNRVFYQQAARNAMNAADQLAGNESATISGRITGAADGVITIVSTTHIDAPPETAESAIRLLDAEAVVTVEYDEDGKLIATRVTATES